MAVLPVDARLVCEPSAFGTLWRAELLVDGRVDEVSEWTLHPREAHDDRLRLLERGRSELAYSEARREVAALFPARYARAS